MEITFERDAIDHVLASFNASIDKNGYIIDAESGERLKNPEGEEIEAEDLAIVEDGSTLFVDDNFGSIVEHVERQR